MEEVEAEREKPYTRRVRYFLLSSLLMSDHQPFLFVDTSSAIQYAVNLHQYHNMPVSEAYLRAVAQFRALRSEHHIASTSAVYEAETFGAVFENTEVENNFEKEMKALETWKHKEETDEGALVDRKR